MKKNFLEESAGAQSTTEVLTVGSFETLREIEERIHDIAHSLKMLQYIYVLSEDGKIEGVFSMRDIFSYSPSTQARDVMKTDLIWVSPDTDQETAAVKALQGGIKAMPVLEKDGTFLGVITSDTIFKILSEEHSEDLLYIGGIQKMYSASSILKDRIRILLLARLPWLLVGLMGGFLAAMTVEGFEGVLKDYIVLAFFLPLVVYMSDAVASQTLAIFIRALALDHSFSIKSYILRELVLGVFIGLVLGVTLMLVSLVWFADMTLSFVLGIALFFAVLVAIFVALSITLILDFFGKDPAVGGGPFATIIIDIVTIFIYFSIAAFLLPGLTT